MPKNDCNSSPFMKPTPWILMFETPYSFHAFSISWWSILVLDIKDGFCNGGLPSRSFSFLCCFSWKSGKNLLKFISIFMLYAYRWRDFPSYAYVKASPGWEEAIKTVFEGSFCFFSFRRTSSKFIDVSLSVNPCIFSFSQAKPLSASSSVIMDTQVGWSSMYFALEGFSLNSD